MNEHPIVGYCPVCQDGRISLPSPAEGTCCVCNNHLMQIIDPFDAQEKIERLEAQRKELREASKRLIGSLSVMITDPDSCDDIIFAKAALKATQ